MRGTRLAFAAAMAMAGGSTSMAAPFGGNSGHEPHWLTDPQTECYVFYMDRHPADVVTWSGDCADGMASGTGMATFTDRSRFVESISGPFLKGAAEGNVRVTWADGSHFEGTESAGRFNGPGVLTHANGDRFEGQWTNNRLNGHGSITWANGDHYDGDLRDSKAEGHGVQTWADGRKYDGPWKDDLPNGHGMLTHKDGSTAEAEFVDGELQSPATALATDDSRSVADATPIKTAATNVETNAATAVATAPKSVAAAIANPPSPAPVWLAPLAGAKLVAVDGTGLAISLSAGGLVRETTGAGGVSQRTYFTFLNSRQGTVSDTADAAKVTGVFRVADAGVAIDYADGHSELVQPNGAGGVAVTTTLPGQGSFCTGWYPQGHGFTSADREAALAAYASRLGVSTSKRKSAACVAPPSDNASTRTEASTRPASKSTRNRHIAAEKAAAAVGTGMPTPLQSIAVRESQIHPIDRPSGSVVLASVTASRSGSTELPPVPVATGPSSCLSVDSEAGRLGFRNSCGFDVQYAWCVRAAADPAKSCGGGGANAGSVSAHGFDALFAQADLRTNEYDLRWIACSGARGEVQPRLVRDDPPAGECVRARG